MRTLIGRALLWFIEAEKKRIWDAGAPERAAEEAARLECQREYEAEREWYKHQLFHRPGDPVPPMPPHMQKRMLKPSGRLHG